ncbi:MAG: lytic transglycosylase [Deltaproteobacteria bacterium]|nr:MAG: lytic transglycosylase [Deltaproteobacteria bacterium]
MKELSLLVIILSLSLFLACGPVLLKSDESIPVVTSTTATPSSAQSDASSSARGLPIGNPKISLLGEEDLQREEISVGENTRMLKHINECNLKPAPQGVATEQEKAPLEIGEEEKEITFDIPIVVNDRVEYYIEYFKNKHRKEFALWLKRSGKYVPMMKELLRENGLPEDLVYLAMIESGFNPKAYSRRRASGPWQFVYWTGKRYGLVVNWWIDERRDPEKSTIAAARYLKDLYDQFRCWHLAAAGYNAGEGKISRAIRRYRTEDFWELAKYRYLKRETKDFVPKMIAAALIAKEPEKYGFDDIEYDEPIRYEKVKIPDATDLRVIARCCGVDYKTIKALNPELKRWCTPPNYPGYQIKIPAGKKETFLQNFSQLKPLERITFRRHRVRMGETLSQIARRYRTRVKPIMQLNHLRSPRNLRAGTYIVIPIPANKVSSLKKKLGRRGPKAKKARAKNTIASFQEILYVVKKGDTLWDIARMYNLDIEQIRRWNNIRGTLIHPNDKLLLKIRREEKG